MKPYIITKTYGRSYQIDLPTKKITGSINAIKEIPGVDGFLHIGYNVFFSIGSCFNDSIVLKEITECLKENSIIKSILDNQKSKHTGS